MMKILRLDRTRWLAMFLACAMIGSAGCRSLYVNQTLPEEPLPPSMVPPRELEMVSLPTYQLEPPDVLQLEMLKMVPLPPYRVQTHDILQIRVVGTLPDQPIGPIDAYGRPTPNQGLFLIQGEGTINLGPKYGSLRVVGMTVDEIRDLIKYHLESTVLRRAEVMVQLAQVSGMQPVSGEYLIGPDGTINLRQYGSVYVAGKTPAEATVAISQHLAAFFHAPEVSLNVLSYASKFFYVITEGAGLGDNVVPLPITGADTVLDAIATIGGLSQLSSEKIWVARPAPDGFGCEQIMPVDWQAIVMEGDTETNYQLMPDDRVFIAEDKGLALTNYIGKLTAPLERLAGASSLTIGAIRGWQTLGRGYNQNRR